MNLFICAWSCQVKVSVRNRRAGIPVVCTIHRGDNSVCWAPWSPQVKFVIRALHNFLLQGNLLQHIFWLKVSVARHHTDSIKSINVCIVLPTTSFYNNPALLKQYQWWWDDTQYHLKHSFSKVISLHIFTGTTNKTIVHVHRGLKQLPFRPPLNPGEISFFHPAEEVIYFFVLPPQSQSCVNVVNWTPDKADTMCVSGAAVGDGVSASDPSCITDITASLGWAVMMPTDVATADRKQSMKQPITASLGDNESEDAESVWNFAEPSCEVQCFFKAICGAVSSVQLHRVMYRLWFISQHNDQLHSKHTAGRAFYELG